ncbi:MAG: O-antigen ligase family protein [Lachnospiraceae bacterium]|nr:O-antigen ligase family protein [Lachnospiraceae bacterium]
MEIFLAGIILVSVLIQGGFYPTIFLGAACALACGNLFSGKRKYDRIDYALCVVVGLYLLTSIINGYGSESLAQACLPGACALFLHAYRKLTPEKKTSMLRKVTLGSWIFAGGAILAFCGIIPLTGAISSRRLQFTFQYANAAGSWFAAQSLLSQNSEEPNIRRSSLPMLTALLLTRSIGALGLYAIAELVTLWHRRQEYVWQDMILEHVLAAGFALVFYVSSGWIAVVLLLILYVAGWYWGRVSSAFCKMHLHWAALLIGIIGATAVFLSQRFSSGLHTFVERLVQILDGLRIIATHPLYGIGAGNWEELYPYYQSAQYTSSVVHSSVIQIGADAGIFTIIAAIAFFIFAWRRGGRKFGESLAAMLLATHSLLDFTLQFFPITVLLLALLFAGEEPVPAKQRWLEPAVLLAFGILCGGLLWGQLQYKQMVQDAQAKDWSSIIAHYGRVPFGESPTARSVYLQALYNEGNIAGVVQTAQSAEKLRTEELVLYLDALYRLGRDQEACGKLLEELEHQLFRVSLFWQGRQLLLGWEADNVYLERYNEIVDMANGSQTVLGRLMGNQVYIEYI